MPYRTEWLPAELLPIIPPSVARLLVEVSGPNMSPWRAAARFNCSWTTPGWTRARRASASIATTWFMCREKSSTTARPTACPARLVPAPRGSTGTPNPAAVATAAAASSASLGNTTPSGSIAYMLASREKRCRLYESNRTPPLTTRRSALASSLLSRAAALSRGPALSRAAAESGTLIPPPWR